MREHRFSQVEIIVVGVVLLALCSVLALRLAKPKHRPSYIPCAARLDRIGIEFTRYANDHNGSYPMELSITDGGTRELIGLSEYTFVHFQALSNSSMNLNFLNCPQDKRVPAVSWEKLSNTNISYFVGIDAKRKDSSLILAGDRNIALHSSSIITLQSGLSWIASLGLHTNFGHILFADGHVEMLDSLGLNKAIQRGGDLTNRIAVP